MTTYSLPTPKLAVARSNFLHGAAILASAIVAIGYAGPVSADPFPRYQNSATVNSPSSERTLPHRHQARTPWPAASSFSALSRHNTDGYARPLDARMALEDCQKGNVASGVAALKRVLERAQIPIPPTESAAAQTPAPLKPHGEKRRSSQ